MRANRCSSSKQNEALHWVNYLERAAWGVESDSRGIPRNARLARWLLLLKRVVYRDPNCSWLKNVGTERAV